VDHLVRFDEAPLSVAGVFLITGPTGAEKSTLLDMMTLALSPEPEARKTLAGGETTGHIEQQPVLHCALNWHECPPTLECLSRSLRGAAAWIGRCPRIRWFHHRLASGEPPACGGITA
jgi:energy-coupling factor transporter ATP-binding protein EcfA2